ncbi:MAG: hypothetical protein LBR26_01375 [Prevotella sp.]|nr:hypothetical protein [Prevotella sp.]
MSAAAAVVAFREDIPPWTREPSEMSSCEQPDKSNSPNTPVNTGKRNFVSL